MCPSRNEMSKLSPLKPIQVIRKLRKADVISEWFTLKKARSFRYLCIKVRMLVWV